jgi:hypothetical protein
MGEVNPEEVYTHQGAEALCQWSTLFFQPFVRTTLEADPAVPIQPSYDCSLLRDLKPNYPANSLINSLPEVTEKTNEYHHVKPQS